MRGSGVGVRLPNLRIRYEEASPCRSVPHGRPFQWTKQVASHFGGTRNGLIVHFQRLGDAGGPLAKLDNCIKPLVVPTDA